MIGVVDDRKRGRIPFGVILPALMILIILMAQGAQGSGAVTGAAQAAQVDEAVSPVQGAVSDSVWYDADTGDVVPVYVKPEVDDSINRESRWLPKAERIAQKSTAANAPAGAGGGGIFGSGLSIGNLFGWFLLLAIVAGAVAAIIYAFSKAELDINATSRSRSDLHSATPDEQTIERMKHLPAELRRTDVNLRSEAERLMNQGNYDQAIILLFGHQLLLLDRVGMLRLNRGKTNRKYVRETRDADAGAAKLLRSTVTAFERSYFGRHEISQREFAELWRANEQLERMVQQRRETAA